MSRPDHADPRHRIHHRGPVMYRQIACEAQRVQPNPHRLSQRVCYHSLHDIDDAFALPLSPETRSRLPQALRHATQKRQREFLAGRWCAKQALQCLGAGSTQVAMAENRSGPTVWSAQSLILATLPQRRWHGRRTLPRSASIRNRSSTLQRRVTSPTSVWSMRRCSSRRPMAAAFANSAHLCFQQRRLSSSVFSRGNFLSSPMCG
jgi:4'-phosphopantetheinyl transferase N-terminal domain